MDAFIARQPILDTGLSVQAYELLFRSGFENACKNTDLDQACAKVIADSLLLPRLDAVSGGKQVFINITRDLLVRECFSLLPPGSTVIEILETVTPDPEVLGACRRLKELGYRLALDDFRSKPASEPLVALADIVKVDVLATSAAERAELARKLKPRGVTLLAEKVETRDIYKETAKLGYNLFQGYFFARPVVLTGRDIPASKRSYLQILREIHRPELDYRAMCEIIEREVALSYKLLRYINSAFFGWRGSVSSIRHALLLLGQREIRRWATVIAMAGIAHDEPGELVALTLLRGRFCELLAPQAELAGRSSDLFLMGLFSLLDAMLQCPLEEILDEIPIARDAKAALLGHPGPLQDVLELVIGYTMGEWPVVEERAARLNIPEMNLPELYESALEWCEASHNLTSLTLAA